MIDGRKKRLPVGIEDFREIRTKDFYYTDKTAMIRGLLEKWGKVNSVHPSQTLRKDAKHEYAQGVL